MCENKPIEECIITLFILRIILFISIFLSFFESSTNWLMLNWERKQIFL